MWHAYASDLSLSEGTALLITGGDEMVALAAGEELGIELPDGEQISASISSCEGGLLVLNTSNGAVIELHRVEAHAAFAAFKLSDGFSRQIWTVH